MAEKFPPAWADLKYPWIRSELLEILDEQATDNPLESWSEQSSQGKCAGFDEVVHFLLDDHEFDGGDIGLSLLSECEVHVICDLKTAIGQICDDLPTGTDEQSVSHSIWPQVRSLARIAANVLRSN